jgi:glutaminyl-tRNA synthetase
VRLYEHLFASPDPDDVPEGESWLNQVNEASLKVVQAFVEPALSKVSLGTTVQFERSGYFCLDQDTTASELVFNRTVTLRDTWAKVEKRG